MFLKGAILYIVSLFCYLHINVSDCLFIDGCPLYGCRPSGTFSFYLKVPRENVSIKWQTRFIIDAIPDGLGCSANSVSIVCQSNGPFSEDKGYMSLYHDNGTIRWRDGVLNFPTLPILDNYGDVTGSDGVSLVHFDADGKNYPVIPCKGLKPIFSMQLVGSIYLLMVSQRGGLSVRDTSAIPVAEIFLNDTVQRVNGTFLPISTPVVNGNRFYLLTEFVPDFDHNSGNILNLQRLYAIDIHHRMADIMTIAWYYNFEIEESGNKPNTLPKLKAVRDKQRPYNKANMTDIKDFKFRQESLVSKQTLLWNSAHQMVYVILPPPYSSNSRTTFWGFIDKGNTAKLAFRSYTNVEHMAIFEANDVSDGLDSDLILLWVTLANSSVCSVMANGNLSRCIDLNEKLKAKVTVTSKLSLVRNKDANSDVLLFGVSILPTAKTDFFFHKFLIAETNNTNYVVALDTAPSSGEVLWVVPSPENLEVFGQITGAAGAAYREKDQIVVFANSDGKSAKVFTIY